VQVIADHQTPGLASISALTERLLGGPLPPLARGIGPTLLPHLQRLYFWFGAPIDTARYHDASDPEAAARELRDRVKQRLERQIAGLLTLREQVP
jgi:hypothetical protein